MSTYVKLKTAHGTYLQAFPDGSVRAVERPGPGAKFELSDGLGPWEPKPELPPAPELAPITQGHWSANFLYGPPGSYFKPACVNFPEDRFADILDWNMARGYTHLVINALEQDHWGADRGHPEWTVKRHRWYDSRQAENIMLARLHRVREAGLQPIVGLFEHTSLPMATGEAIERANRAVNKTHQDVSLYIMCWETDERIPHSQDRLDFETELLRNVDWHGRDVGIHYSQVKRLEGSGVDANDAWRTAMQASPNPGRVVKLYQSRRNAPLDELKWESELLTDVAERTGNCLAAFEHSGTDSAIGQTVSLAQANERAKACYEIMRAKLPADRTGSMNGAAW